MTLEDGDDYPLNWANYKYRARVRVVDMFPAKLSDFSRSLADPMYGNPNINDEELDKVKNQFRWNFTLLIEDAKVPAGKPAERMVITIGNEQGQCLLKMDAVE